MISREFEDFDPKFDLGEARMLGFEVGIDLRDDNFLFTENDDVLWRNGGLLTGVNRV